METNEQKPVPQTVPPIAKDKFFAALETDPDLKAFYTQHVSAKIGEALEQERRKGNTETEHLKFYQAEYERVKRDNEEKDQRIQALLSAESKNKELEKQLSAEKTAKYMRDKKDALDALFSEVNFIGKGKNLVMKSFMPDGESELKDGKLLINGEEANADWLKKWADENPNLIRFEGVAGANSGTATNPQIPGASGSKDPIAAYEQARKDPAVPKETLAAMRKAAGEALKEFAPDKG